MEQVLLVLLGSALALAATLVTTRIARLHEIRVGLLLETLPAIRGAIETPEGVVDATALEMLTQELERKCFLLSKQEYALARSIAGKERHRFALVGFDVPSKTAQEELALKEDMLETSEALESEIKRNLRPFRPRRDIEPTESLDA